MGIKLEKPNFNIGPKTERTTIRFPKYMNDAMEELSKKTGESIPEIICVALEHYLTELAKARHIQFPKNDN